MDHRFVLPRERREDEINGLIKVLAHNERSSATRCSGPVPSQHPLVWETWSLHCIFEDSHNEGALTGMTKELAPVPDDDVIPRGRRKYFAMMASISRAVETGEYGDS